MTATVARREKGTGSYVYREPEGRWQGKITHRGRTYYVSVAGPNDHRTEAKIKKELKDLAADIAEGRALDNRQTVGQYLKWWVDEVKAPTRQISTVAGYRRYIKDHLEPALGRILLRDLTPQDVQAGLNEIARKPRSPRTVQQARGILRAALEQALSYGLVTRNAAAPVSLSPVRTAEVRPFTPEEAKLFLDAIAGDRLEALYTVAISIGLRQSEALGLRWKDVDLKKTHRVTVRQKLVRLKGEITFDAPKTERSRRTIVLPAAAVDALQEHQARQREERKAWLKAGQSWPAHDLVYTLADGSPLVGSTVTHQFQRLLRAKKLRVIRFHDLRHSCASLLLAQGATLKDVMETLGHSQIGLTANLYGHLYDDRRDELAAMMDRALGG